MVRLIHLVMAVSAIQSKLARVEAMVEWDRLSWLVANAHVLRRHIIRDAGEERCHEDEDKNNDLQRQRVRPLGKHFRHSEKWFTLPVPEKSLGES